jgi:hypothetical protein
LESATLAVDLDGLANEIPDPKHHTGSFEPTEDVKLVPLDPTDPKGKALSISFLGDFIRVLGLDLISQSLGRNWAMIS